jgi:CRP-like cAMP-binding protein
VGFTWAEMASVPALAGERTSRTGIKAQVRSLRTYNVVNIFIRIPDCPPERVAPLRIQVPILRNGPATRSIPMPPSSRVYKNRVLAALPAAEIGRLSPHLSPVKLKLRTHLLDGRTDHAYFLEEGLASVVLTLADGASVEVGVIGVDGVVGLPVLLGAERMPGSTFIQVAGSGFRVNAEILKTEFERAGTLRNHLQKYLLANLVQSAQNAACNRLHTISQRLGRWILTCHDRVQSERMPLTHEFLGQMLGAPRTTVTQAAGMLHRASCIDYTRGHVTIKNRQKLERAACECYRIVRDEFDRLRLF